MLTLMETEKVDNGSNKLGDTGDYRIIGNNTPRYKFGLTLDAAWKGWDFRVFFQGVAKTRFVVGRMLFLGSQCTRKRMAVYRFC